MDRLILTKCNRCNGAMVYDIFYGSHGQFWGLKCLICGEIVDPLILSNRQSMTTGPEIAVRRDRR